MNDTSLRRIHDFTANYFFWQGLRWVPIGAALLLLSLQPGKLLPFVHGAAILVAAAIFAIALAISSRIGRWYRRNFGAVRGESTMHARRNLLKWTVFFPMLAMAEVLDCLWRPPILLSGLAWAVAIVAYWASTGRGRDHYIVISGAFAVSTFAPLVLGPGSVIQRMRFLVALIGLVYVVAGVLDHLALLRMLHGKETGDAAAV